MVRASGTDPLDLFQMVLLKNWKPTRTERLIGVVVPFHVLNKLGGRMEKIFRDFLVRCREYVGHDLHRLHRWHFQRKDCGLQIRNQDMFRSHRIRNSVTTTLRPVKRSFGVSPARVRV